MLSPWREELCPSCCGPRLPPRKHCCPPSCPPPRYRRLPASLQPPAQQSSLLHNKGSMKRAVLFFDSAARPDCCGSLCVSNATFPLDQLAYRQLGHRIAIALQQQGVEVVEYIMETDLWWKQPFPECDVVVMLTHDWPTIHEHPEWAADWLEIVVSSNHACVPSSEQILWVLEKTRYVAAIQNIQEPPSANNAQQRAEGAPLPLMLPTRILSGDASDLPVTAAWAAATSPGMFVTKENFSAGKEGVKFCKFKTARDAEKQLERVMATAGDVPVSKVKRQATGSGLCGCFSGCKYSAAQAEELQRAFGRIHGAFEGGNRGVFMVQQFEPRFAARGRYGYGKLLVGAGGGGGWAPSFSSSASMEKRLFFCLGVFLYAMGHAGWIGVNGTPRELRDPAQTVAERAAAERLLRALPELAGYALVRLDFGPGAMLSEIEVLPDMFGGPSGDLQVCVCVCVCALECVCVC